MSGCLEVENLHPVNVSRARAIGDFRLYVYKQARTIFCCIIRSFARGGVIRGRAFVKAVCLIFYKIYLKKVASYMLLHNGKRRAVAHIDVEDEAFNICET